VARDDDSDDETTGPGAAELSETDLLRELHQLHRTRHETLRHGSEDALVAHTSRLTALEHEYRKRFPAREVDPERLREGAKARADDGGR
jgi:uncharacterized protein DUF6158